MKVQQAEGTGSILFKTMARGKGVGPDREIKPKRADAPIRRKDGEEVSKGEATRNEHRRLRFLKRKEGTRLRDAYETVTPRTITKKTSRKSANLEKRSSTRAHGNERKGALPLRGFLCGEPAKGSFRGKKISVRGGVQVAGLAEAFRGRMGRLEKYERTI